MFASGFLARMLIAVLLIGTTRADSEPSPVSSSNNDITTPQIMIDPLMTITISSGGGVESSKKAWEAFLATVECFEETPAYIEVEIEYHELLLNMSQQIISETPTTYPLAGNYRAVYFRKGTMTYIRIEKKTTNTYSSDYSLKSYLFRDDVDVNSCFHVAPDSCEFTGTGVEIYDKICTVERRRAQVIKQGVVNLVSNTGLSAQEVTEAIAQCIKDNITIHTLSIDCAVNGIKTSREEIIIMLEAQAAILRQAYPTVEVNYDNLTVNYS